MVQMCNAFAHLGHEVTLLITDRETTITETPEEYFGIKFNFSFVRLPVPDIAGRSPRIPPVLRRYFFFIQRVVFAYQAFRHIRSEKYTYLYGRDEWILWFLGHFVSVPAVWESHAAKFSFIARRLLKKLDHVVVISEGIRDFYIAHGVSRATLLVAHDAVDERFFEPHITTLEARKDLGIKTQKPVVIYIGGLESWKGAVTFFESVQGQNVFDAFVIGGKEAEQEIFQARYPEVHFLGFLPYKGLPRYQQAADILVIPNTAKEALSAEYTSPLKLFSYMTAKKPIVASRIPSITNVLTPDMAYFFTADDPRSLRDTIIEVLNDTEEGIQRSVRAYEKSRQHTWLKRAQEIIQFIQ